MCVSIFSATLFKIFPILRRIKRDTAINVKRFHVKTRFYFRILMKVEFQQIFKNLNIKFHQNPSSGSRVLHVDTDGRT